MKNKIKGCVLGSAIGDAVGVPYEFSSREKIQCAPATDMIGYGTYNQVIGTWSDDTSMILAAMDAMLSGLDYNKVMQNFCSWSYEAKFTPHGRVFDIGSTIDDALSKFYFSEIPALRCGSKSEKSNGNGSLMRISPFALYCYLKDNNCILDEKTAEVIHNGSALTHSHMRSLIACGIYASIIFELLRKQEKSSIYTGLEKAYEFYFQKSEYQEELRNYERLFEKGFDELQEADIKSSGYVLHSLEAAIWCALTTNTYKESVLKAVNLGGDTDTIASITGGMTGILYGTENVPEEWKKNLTKLDYIEGLCDSFAEIV